jgi:hypothetical protein
VFPLRYSCVETPQSLCKLWGFRRAIITLPVLRTYRFPCDDERFVNVICCKSSSELTGKERNPLIFVYVMIEMERNEYTSHIVQFSLKIKVKLSLCLIKHRSVKAYGGEEVQHDAFLTSALHGGKWSASRCGTFTYG